MSTPKRTEGRAPSRPSIIDVARRAQVSTGTVSNVLNNPSVVSEDKRVRVLAAIQELGFSRNKLATALVHGRTKTIGLVTIDLSNSLFVDIARGAQRQARERGMYMQLAFAEDDPELFEEHMSALNDERVAGLLLAPMTDHHESIERSRRAGCPVVEVNHDGTTPSCRVLVDNEIVGYIAVRHLIGLGRTRIAFVLGRTELQPVAFRREGIKRAIAETNGAVSLTEYFADGIRGIHGTRIGRELAALPEDERPDAVVAVTDLLGMAVVNELTSAGIRVPDDVAVMGCDHNSAAWGGAVPLTSVEMRGEEMGTAGIRLLLDEINDPPAEHIHRTVMLEPRLSIRESTVGRETSRVR